MVDTVVLGIALAGGLYMAWNIGANDVANAMGTSVGSRAVTLKQAILVAGLFEFLGAVLVGSHVTQTISRGIVDPRLFIGVHREFVLGMLAALLSAGIWLQLATYLGLPVSTTHSIVGAVVGFGLVSYGVSAVEWGKLTKIVASWIVSPVMGALISFVLFRQLSKRILEQPYPLRAARRYAPLLVLLVFTILTMSFTYKGLKNLKLDLPLSKALVVALLVGLVGMVFTAYAMGHFKIQPGAKVRERLREVEGIFKYLQVMTACYMAFAHGANDVANATGPIAAIFSTVKAASVQTKVFVPLWVLFIGGLGIVVGLATWGYKVIETVGRRITDITPSRGFCAEFGCATTVLLCSRLGMPISTTHTLVGSVVGVGLARGIGALNLRILKDIFLSWIVTLPFTAGLAMLLFVFLKVVF
ncbi:MAG TPA: inorganic phosphate transporter [Thermosulfidibacter takaii]|uniref:Phosphate transporter n=1 Tax=Thermosulfidibacter takaii TaxID=412593 RepID=A0A7C0U6J1_9BACT|nr:inorganic phosphate transporter [Thermosulfidibacter takaii]